MIFLNISFRFTMAKQIYGAVKRKWRENISLQDWIYSIMNVAGVTESNTKASTRRLKCKSQRWHKINGRYTTLFPEIDLCTLSFQIAERSGIPLHIQHWYKIWWGELLLWFYVSLQNHFIAWAFANVLSKNKCA